MNTVGGVTDVNRPNGPSGSGEDYAMDMPSQGAGFTGVNWYDQNDIYPDAGDYGKFYPQLVAIDDGIKEVARELGLEETDSGVTLFAAWVHQETKLKEDGTFEKTDDNKTGESKTLSLANVNIGWLKKFAGMSDDDITRLQSDLQGQSLIEQTKTIARIVIPLFNSASDEELLSMNEEQRGGATYAAGDERKVANTWIRNGAKIQETGYESGHRYAANIHAA